MHTSTLIASTLPGTFLGGECINTSRRNAYWGYRYSVHVWTTSVRFHCKQKHNSKTTPRGLETWLRTRAKNPSRLNAYSTMKRCTIKRKKLRFAVLIQQELETKPTRFTLCCNSPWKFRRILFIYLFAPQERSAFWFSSWLDSLRLYRHSLSASLFPRIHSNKNKTLDGTASLPPTPVTSYDELLQWFCEPISGKIYWQGLSMDSGSKLTCKRQRRNNGWLSEKIPKTPSRPGTSPRYYITLFKETTRSTKMNFCSTMTFVRGMIRILMKAIVELSVVHWKQSRQWHYMPTNLWRALIHFSCLLITRCFFASLATTNLAGCMQRARRYCFSLFAMLQDWNFHDMVSN
jgi:hypothetical protein